MATIQFKRRTTGGSGPLTGTSGIVKAGEPQIDFTSGHLYVSKLDKTGSVGNPISVSDYVIFPSTTNVDDQISTKVSSLALGTASTKNAGIGSGNVPILDANGKLADSVIPKIAMTNTFVVASQSAMLSLSSAQEGDVAIRTDLSKSFILISNSYSSVSAWQELLTPTDSVTSVNGKIGSVNISLAELGGVASTTFNSHTSSSVHLSIEQITKLSNMMLTKIDLLNGSSYEPVLSTFNSKIIINGLVLYSYIDTKYTPNRRVYAYGINKDMVLTPSSIIDGGTF